MLAHRTPQETYARIDFDARVAGASPAELVLPCYEQLVASLGAALYADRSGDARARGYVLTRALTALTAFEIGIDG